MSGSTVSSSYCHYTPLTLDFKTMNFPNWGNFVYCRECRELHAQITAVALINVIILKITAYRVLGHEKHDNVKFIYWSVNLFACTYILFHSNKVYYLQFV